MNAKFGLIRESKDPILLWLVDEASLKTIEPDFPAWLPNWLTATGFSGQPGQICAVPGRNGAISAFLAGIDPKAGPLAAGKFAKALPAGTYKLAGDIENPQMAALGFSLGAYSFDRYKSNENPKPTLLVPEGVDSVALERNAEAVYLVRDLINTPANDMGPEQLEAEFLKLAGRYSARAEVICGEQLLAKNFPMIHAVGRASSEEPRLLDMVWGDESDPKLTLVGKGVCFDTGGLNLKPGTSMSLMKKDMGGAANVLGLAQMIMSAGLPVRLRVLVPAVENAVSGSSFRPGDILQSRKGISVEIGNTDAEGRLVLGDALTLADEEDPDLIIDMATLTGAARVALGPDLPPFYTLNDELANEVMLASEVLQDPLWRLPLWQPYDKMLSSKVADASHISSGAFAGSITAALFLKKFIRADTDWLHFDIFGWVPTAKPWAPVGGEAQGIRALFHIIEKRYRNNSS
jgi:leucyl aminopeptidase